MSTSLSLLALHAVDTLPDSVSKRKQLLLAIQETLKANHPARSKVAEMLCAIEQMEKVQPLLSAEFQNLLSEKPKTKGPR